MKNLSRSFAAAAFGVLFLAGICHAAAPAGSVTGVVPRSQARRDGREVPLALRSEVGERDVLLTDASGHLEVTFRDGTLLSLGPLSEVNVSEFAMTEDKNAFQSDLIKGAARVVTGEIVKRNPGGFKISTPRSTIGIRGTTVLCVFRGGDEIISVESLGSATPGGGHVTIIDRRGGGRAKIDEAGLAYVRRSGEEGTVTRLDSKKKAAIDALAGYTRARQAPDPGGKVFNDLVDTVIQKPSGIQETKVRTAPSKSPSARSGIVDGRDSDRLDVDRPPERNERPDSGTPNIEPPSPREGEGCP